MTLTIIYSRDFALFIIKPVGVLGPVLFDLQTSDWVFRFGDYL